MSIKICYKGNMDGEQFVRDRITQLRLIKGISEYKMSYDLGHSRGYINNISSGKSMPSMSEFFTICDYLGITPMDFFDSSHDNPSLMRTAINEMQELSADDILVLLSVIQRFRNNRK